MKTTLAAIALASAFVACGGTPKPLPKDLPPPEYEPPRGYDLGGGAQKPEQPPAQPPQPAPPKP